MSQLITVKEAAKLIGITPAAIHRQISRGRILSQRFGVSHMIRKADLKAYTKSRYSKELMEKNGKLVFDKAKGKISIRMASELLGMSVTMVYYFVRRGDIPHKKIDSTFVLKEADVKKFKKSYFSKKD